MKNCLVIQHAEPEGPWAIGDALVRAGVELDVRRVFAGESLPTSVREHGGLVVMGGPASATSDEGFESRLVELRLLADALAAEVPTLGVCLGAQLLAGAAGARVYQGNGLEIGWGPVELTSAARRDDPLLADLPPHLEVLHWHGDTFELPPGSHHLARNERYAHQAFRVGTLAWGLQFHLEVTAAAVEGMLIAFPADASRAPGGSDGVRGHTLTALAELAPCRDVIFDRFAALVAGTDAAAGDGSRHRFVEISSQ